MARESWRGSQVRLKHTKDGLCLMGNASIFRVVGVGNSDEILGQADELVKVTHVDCPVRLGLSETEFVSTTHHA